MNTDIWKVASDIAIEFHSDRVNAIADRISSLSSVKEIYTASLGFGPSANKSLKNELENVWEKNPNILPLEVAAALRGASVAAATMRKREAVEMVWTGPHTGLVGSRHTEQVLLEVIKSAQNRLFIVSFVAYNIDSVLLAMREAMGRNVKIDILFESSKNHGGKIDIDSMETFKSFLPSANTYSWVVKQESVNGYIGAVHAKCAVADGSLAFITSANLTKAAMENNMELGVLIRGGNIPNELDRHLNALVSTKIIRKI